MDIDQRTNAYQDRRSDCAVPGTRPAHMSPALCQVDLGTSHIQAVPGRAHTQAPGNPQLQTEPAMRNSHTWKYCHHYKLFPQQHTLVWPCPQSPPLNWRTSWHCQQNYNDWGKRATAQTSKHFFSTKINLFTVGKVSCNTANLLLQLDVSCPKTWIRMPISRPANRLNLK